MKQKQHAVIIFNEMVTLFLEQLKIASFCNEFPRYIIISQ